MSLSSVIRVWYTKTFGFVSPLTLHSGVRPLIDLLIGFVIAAWLQEQWYWRVPVPAMFIAAVLLCVGVVYRATRRHYIAVAFVWFVMTLAAFGSSDAAKDAVLDLATALCLVIAGVGDHRLLRQTLQPSIEL